MTNPLPGLMDGINRSIERKGCRKHEPEWRSDNLLDQLAGKVRCKNCGMEGCYSNGQRRFGRPRRVIWFRHRFSRPTPIEQTDRG